MITQNVDGLHQAAGARDVIDLHGRLDRVRLPGLRPAVRPGRAARPAGRGQRGLARDRGGAINPDGDVDLPDSALAGFRPVDCDGCAGVLKPDVVFFGETVPPDRVAALLRAAGAGRRSLLVLGLLADRHVRAPVRAAGGRGSAIPVAIVNQGATRGDPYAAVTVDAPLGTVLPAVASWVAAAADARVQPDGAAQLRRAADSRNSAPLRSCQGRIRPLDAHWDSCD